MSTGRVERRLAAILAVDVAGYSRLMGQDEEGTLAALRALRQELGDPKITEHRGRIVKTTGDGLLVEFASVVDAVRCAVEVQREMTARNASVPAARRIEFRMGINVGDIIIEDGDIFGDGVNIAARLETLAEPGGVCLSAAAHEQVRDKLEFSYEDMGEQQVKNIARPVRVYHVRRASNPGPPPAPAAATPDRPSIAVLPFQNLSGDPDQEYFADGIVEDIITGLSRIRWLFVIARNSSFTYKGQAVDVKRVGHDLGVRYVLEGSVRKLGKRIRLTAQLIDTTNAAHVWAERYDRAIDDIFALQDDLTISVIGAIEPSLRQAEIERAKRKRPESLDAYDLYLRALPHVFTRTPESADKALDLLHQSLTIEPDYAAAHAAVAWAHHARFLRRGRQEPEKRAALRHARMAVATGGDDSTALGIAAFVIGILDQDYETSLNSFDRALALSPSSSLALGFGSIIRAWAGHDAVAMENAEQALRLSPFDPLIFMPYIGLAWVHFFAGRFDEAAHAASRAAQANSRFGIPWVVRAAALANSGRDEEARACAQRLIEVEPEFTVRGFVSRHAIPLERLAMVAEALRRAGLPEE